jgi:hypothetical protein
VTASGWHGGPVASRLDRRAATRPTAIRKKNGPNRVGAKVMIIKGGLMLTDLLSRPRLTYG